MDVRQYKQKPNIRFDSDVMRSRLRSVQRTIVRAGIYNRPYSPKQTTSIDEQTQITPSFTAPHLLQDVKLYKPVKDTNKRPDLPKQSRSNVLKRHAIKKTFTSIHPKLHHRPTKQILVGGMAIFIVSIGVITIFNIKIHQRQSDAQSIVNSVRKIDPTKILVLQYPLF